MVTDRQLRRSKAIQQRTGRTFSFATRLLPERVRRPTYVLYAFFRTADEVVDGDGDPPPDEQRERLDRLRVAALGEVETDDPVAAAFREVREEYDIPAEEVEVFLDAMATDAEKEWYDSYDELAAYMRGSAAAVGVMMLSVMGVDGDATSVDSDATGVDSDATSVDGDATGVGRDAARPHAVALGEAFQLTNFLRDVREDVVEHGRIYLPASTRERHGVTEADVRRCDPTDGFRAAMAEELRRAERLYREGVAGIEYLPDDCQFAVLYAAVLYAEHHRGIRANDYDVFSSPPTVGPLRAAWLWAKTRWYWRRTRDPVTVFRNASAVPDGDGSHDAPDPTGGVAQID